MPEEKEPEQPPVISINTVEQVKTLIEAKELAEKTAKYIKSKHGTAIYVDQGSRVAPRNPTLAEYLFRAERKIINDMMPEIIKEAESMINEELTSIKELLK